MPPPLPRRGPPLPPRKPTSSSDLDSSESPEPTGIAARIASLQLGQVGRTPGDHSHVPPKAPLHNPAALKRAAPPLPPSSSRPQIDARPDLIRALSRPVPPPPLPMDEVVTIPVADHLLAPVQRKVPPAPTSGRRLPPMPSRLPTPPPEPEQELEPEEEYTDAYTEECIKCRDFSHVDAHAALFPRQSVQSVAHLAYDLSEPFEYETERARAIFTWMHYNIAYDTQAFFSGNLQPSTAESTLRSGLAVCEGYAVLFKALAECVGLQAYVASGHGKGFGYAPLGPEEPLPKFHAGHAWNCVLMDGEWHAIDPCWGAGALEGANFIQRFDPGWFSSNPFEFARTHHPTEPLYQLISEEDGGPISWEEYITAPEKPVAFGELATLGFATHTLEPATKCIEGGRKETFRIFKVCEHMSRAVEDNYVYFINTGTDTRTVMELDEEGAWAAEVYVPRGEEVSLFYVKTLDNWDGKGIDNATFVRSIGRKAMSFGGIARWTAV